MGGMVPGHISVLSSEGLSPPSPSLRKKEKNPLLSLKWNNPRIRTYNYVSVRNTKIYKGKMGK
jgi:hypothetical protein